MAVTCYVEPNQSQTKTLLISYRLLCIIIYWLVYRRVIRKPIFIKIDYFKALKLLNQSNGERKLVL